MPLVSELKAASSAELSVRLVVEPIVVNKAVLWLLDDNAEVVAVSLDTTSDDRIDQIVVVDHGSVTGLMGNPEVVIDSDEDVLIGVEPRAGKVEPTVKGCVAGALITVLAVRSCRGGCNR